MDVIREEILVDEGRVSRSKVCARHWLKELCHRRTLAKFNIKLLGTGIQIKRNVKMILKEGLNRMGKN